MSFPVKFTIRVPGLPEFGIALQRFAVGLSDFTPFWNDYFVPSWYALMAQQYDSEGAFTGDAWDALSANYAAWKQKHWPGQPIGVMTGATRSSLTSPIDPNAVLTISKEKFAVGTGLNYPIHLQIGTSRMPARPPMRVDTQFQLECGKLLQQFAYDEGKKAGL